MKSIVSGFQKIFDYKNNSFKITQGRSRNAYKSKLFSPRRLRFKFKVFEKMTLPSVINQTNKDWIWYIYSSAFLPEEFKERLKKILQHTSGFLYYVSVMGITGTKKPSINEVKKSLKKIRKISNLPICVGFGIKNKNQIQSLNKFSDGCVVGSAIVNFIEEFDKSKYSENQMLKNISDFLANLKK